MPFFRPCCLTTRHVLDYAAAFDATDPAGTYSAETQTLPAAVLAESEEYIMEHTEGSSPLKQEGGVSKESPFCRKPSFLICQGLALVIGIGLLFLLLYPVVGAIAQHVVNVSRLNVDSVAITRPTNTS